MKAPAPPAPAAPAAAATPPTLPPTRQRLIDAALRLFAERGYEGTPVGEIETAAGLVPRSGALYKHFSSKRDLLEAALAERIGAIDQLERELALMPLEDLRAELTVIGGLALAELERERELARIVMKEGDRFPGIAAAFHEAVVERGHRLGRVWLRARSRELGIELDDCDALAEVLTNSLVGYALQGFMFGPGRAAIERERMVLAWAELAAALLGPASDAAPSQPDDPSPSDQEE